LNFKLKGSRGRRHHRKVNAGFLSVIVLCTMIIAATGEVRGDSSNGPDVYCCGGGGGGGQPYDIVGFYSTDLSFGVCVVGYCTGCNTPVYSGSDLYVLQGVQLMISPCGLSNTTFNFWQWTTNAGVIGNPLSATTTFTPYSNNSLWLEPVSPAPNVYAGYVLSYPSMAASLASATIAVPTPTWLTCSTLGGGQCPTETVPGYGTIYNAEDGSYWVGLADGSGVIWQAGIDVFAGTTSPVPGSPVVSFATARYEDVPGGLTYLYSSIHIGFGNRVNVEVDRVSSSRAYYYFYDYNNTLTTSGTISFDAPQDTAEWVLETSSGPHGDIPLPGGTAGGFSSPGAAYTCSIYCPAFAGTFQASDYVDWIYQNESCGVSCVMTDWAVPTALSPGYTSFSV
jgi:Peptidase A4 family